MVIELSQADLLAIRTHAESTYPNECCGLLLGHLSPNKTLVAVMATENAWSPEASEYLAIRTTELASTKRSHYAIAPEVLLKAQREARDRAFDIIGIYHSHPDHPAIPSELDRVYAWHQYSYIIVSVQNGKACDLKSWSLDAHNRFQPEEIVTV